jgi:predicted nucleic acid-binding protein
VRGYLLDANHVSGYHVHNQGFMQKLRSVPPETQLRVCTITLGEIEAGNKITASTAPARRNDYLSFVVSNFHYHAIEIAVTTRSYYADVIGRIWHKHPPPNAKKRTEVHLVEHGVDINDVWAFAVAWEHGLTFLTSDHMAAIQSCVPEVIVENWLS